MGLDVATSVSAVTVFIQGLLSFFSPCVLPLVPLYLGYLAGGALRRNDDGSVDYPRKTVMLNTAFFVLGISFAFLVLALGFTALGRFFSSNQRAFSAAAGIIMVLFGLYMLGFFGKANAVETERRLPLRLDKVAMNPLVALVLGFTFSFAWTPCVGPVLASVLLMASSSASAASGFALVGVYTLGFVLPFLAVGLFTTEVLRFFRSHGGVVRYTVKVGGALLIVMGIMTATGWMNGVTGYLSSFGGVSNALEQPADSNDSPGQVSDADDSVAKDDGGGGVGGDADGNAGGSGAGSPSHEEPSDEGESGSEASAIAAPLADVVLVDQYGEKHALADYRGKVVFLNFFATWCGPCVREIPYIEEAYRQYGYNEGEVAVLSVANPSTSERPN
ncbi:MAG: redoxin domain-containing protein, partial [Eggerthellaceae bacterium]|nr:redoxin domain-containing protein [Eggerthellaceae bacterium]